MDRSDNLSSDFLQLIHVLICFNDGILLFVEASGRDDKIVTEV